LSRRPHEFRLDQFDAGRAAEQGMDAAGDEVLRQEDKEDEEEIADVFEPTAPDHGDQPDMIQVDIRERPLWPGHSLTC